jgi:acyl-CoA synthetase (AMP-forming)/AMP-acid ligase II
VYPREVEEALLRHPHVSQAAVHAVPDPVLGEKGFAWVVPNPGTDPNTSELRAYAAQTLSRFKLPDIIRITDSLPMTSVGKVDRVRLRANAMAEL